MAQKKSFEDNITELEKIISDLESGQAPLEECIKLFEKGIKLSNECIRLIDDAQSKITLLTQEGDAETDFADVKANG